MGLQSIYIRITNDLVHKGQGGYLSNDEFNNSFRDAQNLLLDFYVMKFEKSRIVSDATSPFRPTAAKAVQNNPIDFPIDYRHMISISYNLITTINKISSKKIVPITYLPELEEPMTLSSATRGPSLAKQQIYWNQKNNKIVFYPEISGQVELKYFKQAPLAVREVTINSTTDMEDYNEALTTEHQWPAQAENDLINLLLFYRGLEIRDNEIIQWAMASKKQ